MSNRTTHKRRFLTLKHNTKFPLHNLSKEMKLLDNFLLVNVYINIELSSSVSKVHDPLTKYNFRQSNISVTKLTFKPLV